MKTINSLKIMIGVIAMISTLQQANAQGIGFGIKGGYNNSNIQIDGEVDTDFKSGYHFGLFISKPITEKFIISPSVLYTSKGGNFKESDVYELESGTEISSEFRTNINLSYVEVPIELKYMLTQKFSLSAIPYISFLVNDKMEMYYGECVDGSCTAVKEELDEEFVEFNSTDYGVGFGMGYDINSHLILSAQYQLGLASLIKDDVDAFNRMFSISLGFKF